MKPLLLFSKNLETHFPNKNKEYQSKMDLAISSLVTGDYQKSKDMFDSAIEIDSTFPSAWLGKAFAEVALVPDEKFNDLNIDEFLERALKSKNKHLTSYKVALSGCLAYRHAIIIKESILAVERFLEEQKKAKAKKNAAIATAVIGGAVFSGRNKSLASNIVGGAMMVGGGASALKSGMKEEEFKKLANSLYSKALGQTYLSTPVMYLCASLKDHIDDSTLKNNFDVVINSWKESVLYLYGKQKTQLIETLKKQTVTNAETLETLIQDPNSVQEIGEFSAFMKIIGLSNHTIFDKLNNLFKIELKKLFESEQAMADLAEAKQKQNRAMGIGGLFVLIGFVSIYIVDGNDDLEWVPIVLDIAGLILGGYLMSQAETKEMKAFKAHFDQTVASINDTPLSPQDIDINLIASENSTKTDSGLLDM